ncbi:MULTISPECIES: hypothetical protein [Haloferax]|uniref:Uncharacterized protein n=2 Tax=Haloferax gibbonsii TaxID=35746 RepID=A0A0K1IUV6_HALGI|nr:MULTISPECIES: hypothetical protein [Haloferax]AKU08236.1 hypothetical protein ABY42_11030 [Haloferax gibbonsii]ELZ79811.1 hypothetical protein C454_11428 [Haloferax gibbonsii ATCC 33959]QOS12597.1 uncharacterized protein HfgLR_12300 [Haloferax gibbonsii]RDZ52601.1 hypothetical protein C5C07_12550 [Haloferax sp. Atlit-4N]REA03775.1 hypothetical protein DEQ92_11745 [Haloferax sp. Atlit-6N]
MTKTNWSRFSKLALALVVLLSALAGPVGAVSVASENVPNEAQVGSQVTATATLDELYRNPQLESWTLAGETDLEDVTWTVTYYDQTGAKVDQQSFDGQNFSGAQVAAGDGTSEVEISVTGTVPEVEAYSYDPAQTFTLISLDQTREGGSSNDIDTWTAHHYTEESAAARTELDSAQAAIQSASGANTQQAQQTFNNAVEAFNGEEFNLATNLANEAETSANQAQQSSQTTQLLIYAAGGLLVVALIAGGFLYWRSQQTTYDKLG